MNLSTFIAQIDFVGIAITIAVTRIRYANMNSNFFTALSSAFGVFDEGQLFNAAGITLYNAGYLAFLIAYYAFILQAVMLVYYSVISLVTLTFKHGYQPFNRIFETIRLIQRTDAGGETYRTINMQWQQHRVKILSMLVAINLQLILLHRFETRMTMTAVLVCFTTWFLNAYGQRGNKVSCILLPFLFPEIAQVATQGNNQKESHNKARSSNGRTPIKIEDSDSNSDQNVRPSGRRVSPRVAIAEWLTTLPQSSPFSGEKRMTSTELHGSPAKKKRLNGYSVGTKEEETSEFSFAEVPAWVDDDDEWPTDTGRVYIKKEDDGEF